MEFTTRLAISSLILGFAWYVGMYGFIIFKLASIGSHDTVWRIIGVVIMIFAALCLVVAIIFICNKQDLFELFMLRDHDK